ncbi:MAG: glycine betaine/L-proline ABC transporter ATP-binding protein ProV [Pseudomonadota bacterium]
MESPGGEPAAKLVVRDLTKVFGADPGAALRLLDEGADKDRIHRETGQTVGVDRASFAIREGEVFVVMGLSGSGKSTLVRLLNRLVEPSRGQVLVDGEDIAAMSPRALLELRRRDMSMVFQSFALMPHLRVIDNVAFGLELAGVAPGPRRERAIEALAQVGLEAYAASFPDQLSGGMQQRVGLARALANDPTVMLMDEAFSALDPLIRGEMQEELLKLQAEHRRTIVFISHDLDEAMRIGDRIAIMEGGRVVQVGTPDEILANPADDYVRSFFSGVDISKVLTAGDVARRLQVTLIRRAGGGTEAAVERLRRHDRDFAVVVDEGQRYAGVLTVDSLEAAHRRHAGLDAALLAEVEPLRADQPLNDVLLAVARAPTPVPVVDERGRYVGAISRALLLEALDRSEIEGEAA